MEVLLGCMTTAEGNVEVSPTVEYVNGNAFYGCSGIETLNFNSNEIEFSPDSLSGCENLRTINSANTIDCITYTSYIDSGKKALLGASEKNVITYERKIGILFCNREASGSYTIPDFVRYISERAFANCTGLVVDIPGTVSLESIGDDAFLNSGNDTDANKSNGIFTIGNYIIKASGFNDSSYSVPENIVCIADSAFSNSSLKTITFSGNRLIGIGKKAFEHCKTLEEPTLPDSVTKIGDSAFTGTAFFNDKTKWENGCLYAGNYLVAADKAADEIRIRPGTKHIADSAFHGCDKITSIEIPESVETIGEGAFNDCTQLKTVTFPKNSKLRTIDDEAFINCYNLERISIPDSVETIGDKAFWDCRDLTEVEMGENTNINDIGKYLFSGCNSLTEENVAEPLKPAKAESEKPIENYEPDGPVVDPEPENPVEEPAVQPVIPETTVKIKNYRKDISVDYRSSLTFTAEVENGKAKDVVWLVNGKEYTKGETCTINEAKEKEYKVQCTVKKADGNTAYSETETVTVNTGFFAKIIAFFRGIFKKLPVYIDNAKK